MFAACLNSVGGRCSCERRRNGARTFLSRRADEGTKVKIQFQLSDSPVSKSVFYMRSSPLAEEEQQANEPHPFTTFL